MIPYKSDMTEVDLLMHLMAMITQHKYEAGIGQTPNSSTIMFLLSLDHKYINMVKNESDSRRGEWMNDDPIIKVDPIRMNDKYRI